MKLVLIRNIRVLQLFFSIVLLWSLVSCGGDDNPSDGGKTDKTPPTVIRTTPQDGDSTVSDQIEVSATFSEPMDAASITTGTLSLTPDVAGTVGYADSAVIFTPAFALDTNETYTATVSTAAKDLAGNPLATAFSWQFSTFLDHTPPTVTETSPADGDPSVLSTATVQAVFSEKMDLSTISTSSFYLSPAVSATVSKTNLTATLQPLVELDTFQLYTATLTTDITDSAGNPLASEYTWSFHTTPDVVPPTASLDLPFDNAVVSDSIAIIVEASDNDAVRNVDFYADGAIITGATDSTSPYEYIYDATTWDTASVHTIFAQARDRRGNVTSTDTAAVHFHWRLLTTDKEDLSFPRNIKAVYERSTSSQVQFRVETYNGWGHYKDRVGGIDCAFYLDTDQNQATGDNQTADGTIIYDIGDIGAEYCLVIGFSGDVLKKYANGSWSDVGYPALLKMQDNTNVFEVGLNRSQIDYDDLFDIVVVNVNWDDYPNPLLYDWVPDSGHRTVTIDGTYQDLTSGSSGSPVTREERSAVYDLFD